jgi:hypothetical protein
MSPVIVHIAAEEDILVVDVIRWQCSMVNRRRVSIHQGFQGVDGRRMVEEIGRLFTQAIPINGMENERLRKCHGRERLTDCIR